MDRPVPFQLLEDCLIALYEEVLREPTFEKYEANSDKINALFLQLQQREPQKHDHGKLSKIKMLHDQIMSMIHSEKDSLEKEILFFRSKKNASNQYGKVSVYETMDAFFIDYKK
ncbi:hypothetical protein [Paenibacillus brevis]|uniref:Flagellar protein FliT n=1 Tax=Paenibacillus brevis TaxID=2841508 RepID=A0ABS6FL79_9BACL|nr:hypothetical protein [Paenibacillus brevis]MBU5670957.1 hypothetical protein [Paenibacillus brevis]